jgi:o-succinylbenzoate synthase
VHVERIVLRLITAELTRPFENRWQRFNTWTKLTVQVDSGGVSGFAECAAMEAPFYNYETVETAWYVIEQYLAPWLLQSEVADPLGAMELWREVNGHEEAKGALECALWDLQARLADRPLCVELGGQIRPVPVGATAGIEASINELLDNVEHAYNAGYRRIRLKIRPGWDLEPMRAVRSSFPDFPIIADANGAYKEDDLDQLVRLDGLGLMAIEQPFPRYLLETTAALQQRIATPICLDESVKSLVEIQQAHRLDACQMVNIKVGRVGGLAEARRIHDFCQVKEIKAFVGGKWDQGLGRWTNLALATLPNMTLPNDIGASSEYYLDDGAEPKVEFSEPGWVQPLNSPGLGAQPSTGKLQVARERALTASTTLAFKA